MRSFTNLSQYPFKIPEVRAWLRLGRHIESPKRVTNRERAYFTAADGADLAGEIAMSA
jgi:hypothetical protein